MKVLRVMFELAKNSTSCMLQLVQMNAMKLLNFLLRKVSELTCQVIVHHSNVCGEEIAGCCTLRAHYTAIVGNSPTPMF